MSTVRASLAREDSHSDEKNNKSESSTPPPRVKKVSIILDSAPADMDKLKLNMMTDSSSKHKSGEKHRSVFYKHKSSGDSLKLKSSDSNKRKSVGDLDSQDISNNVPVESETSNELVCDSSHDAREMMSVVFPINIDVLVATLYSKSKTVLQFRELRKQSNIVLGDWTANEDGTKSRTIKFTQALKKGLGPKASQVRHWHYF